MLTAFVNTAMAKNHHIEQHDFKNHALPSDLTVKLNGRVDAQMQWVDQKKGAIYDLASTTTHKKKRVTNGVVTDTKLDFTIEGKSGVDLTYGGLMRLNADMGKSISGETDLINRAMIFMQHNKFGRIELGSTPSAQGMLENDIDNFAVGTYGVNGYSSAIRGNSSFVMSSAAKNLFDTANAIRGAAPADAALLDAAGNDLLAVGGQSVQFLLYPCLPSNYSGHYFSNSPKINLFTKPINSLTVGFSYTPNLDSYGRNRSAKNTTSPKDERGLPATYNHVMGLALTYEENFADYLVKLHVSGEQGVAKEKLLQPLKAVEYGTMLGYQNWRIAATYGDWFKTLTLRENNTAGRKVQQTYWTLGIGQQFDKYGYSVTYLNSKKAGGLEALTTNAQLMGALGNNKAFFTDTSLNRYNNIVIDVDYKLMEGVKVYGAVAFFKLKESKGNYQERGKSMIIGTRFLF